MYLKAKPARRSPRIAEQDQGSVATVQPEHWRLIVSGATSNTYAMLGEMNLRAKLDVRDAKFDHLVQCVALDINVSACFTRKTDEYMYFYIS